MKRKLILSLLLFAPLCGAQSAPTPAVPIDSTRPSSSAPQSVPLNPTTENMPAVEQRGYPESFGTGGNPSNRTLPPPGWAAPRRAEPMQKSEFEMFAEDAAGHPVSVYGRQLFEEVPTTFAPMDRMPVPADYVIGPGDELMIRVWGKVELQSRVTVDRNGQIFIPRVGALTVAGLRYEQLEGNIHAAMANLYKDFDLNVTMGQLRSIQIFVLGSARQPGVYTVSSLATLVNALFASGGPSATGSMRDIQLRRGNRCVTEFDVYDLLRNGDKSHDAQLLPGDVIYIPPVGPQTAVLGSVKEPGIYELKSDSTVGAILKDVAGLSNLASVDRALLERVENHRRRQVEEFALDDAGLKRQLKDGDILRVFPISPRFDNAVTLRGNVAQPGRYLWHEGMRVSDLIPNRDTLLTRDYWNRQNFLASTLPPSALYSQELNQGGMNPLFPQNFANQENFRDQQNFANQPNASNPQTYLSDQAYAYGYGDANNANGQGYGNNPNNQLYASLVPYAAGGRGPGGLTNNAPPQIREHWDRPKPPFEMQGHDVLADVTEASTDINWEYAAIERRDENDLSTQIIAFDLGNAIDKPTSTDNHPLKPGDVLTIFSRKDMPLPQDKHAAFVRIGGEVNAPGVYRIRPGETLRELVVRAGGLTQHSYLYASQLTRVSTRRAQEEELRISAAQMQRDLSSRYAASSSVPGAAAAQQAQLSVQQAALAQLTSVHPTGRIVLDMKPEAGSVNDIPEFPLEDGDNYYVPAALGTVQVAGAVYNENAFRYQEHKRLSSYLRAAGGPTRQADRKRTFLIRADGTVISRQDQSSPWRSSFDSLKVLPGDAIVVPTKMKSPNSAMQQIPYWTSALSQTAMAGAVVATNF